MVVHLLLNAEGEEGVEDLLSFISLRTFCIVYELNGIVKLQF